ncbi:MAG: hypothetical protein ABGW81_07535 [Paracoccaceae bacterium]
MINEQVYQLIARNSDGRIRTGEADSPDVVMTTSYEAIMALADGDMPRDEFLSKHVALDVMTSGKGKEFFDLLARAMRGFD